MGLISPIIVLASCTSGHAGLSASRCSSSVNFDVFQRELDIIRVVFWCGIAKDNLLRHFRLPGRDSTGYLARSKHEEHQT